MWLLRKEATVVHTPPLHTPPYAHLAVALALALAVSVLILLVLLASPLHAVA